MKLMSNMPAVKATIGEKWLKDRRERDLPAEDIAHYQKVVVALKETIRLTKEIDAVLIEIHSGWRIK